MATTANVKIGDVEVYLDFGDGNGEQYLGHTKGGVEFTYEREFEDLTVDKYGSAPVDKSLTGTKLMAKAMLAEPTNTNLSHAVKEGLYAENANDSKIGFGTESGYLASDNEATMRLHPRKNAADSRDEDVYLWRVHGVESIALNYKVDEQRLAEVTWEAMIDDSQPNGQLLGRIGDADIS